MKFCAVHSIWQGVYIKAVDTRVIKKYVKYEIPMQSICRKKSKNGVRTLQIKLSTAFLYLYYHLNGPCSDELCCNWFWNWIKLHCHPVHALRSKSAVLLNNWITNHFECIKALYIPLVYISLLKFVFTKLQTSGFATLHIHSMSSKIRKHIWNTRRHFETCNSVCVCAWSVLSCLSVCSGSGAKHFCKKGC